MRTFIAALGLSLAAAPGAAMAFVIPAGGRTSPTLTAASRDASRRTRPLGGQASANHAGCIRSKEAAPTMIFADAAAQQVLPRGFVAWGPAGTARRDTATALGAGGSEEEEKPNSAAAMSGVGSAGSNLLLLVTLLMVIKGLLLPESVRHLGFCPIEDPIRGRDTLPWRMMIESGRECGTIPEVMTKYITAPLAFPGTPEWGMMLNIKEDLAKDAWLQ